MAHGSVRSRCVEITAEERRRIFTKRGSGGNQSERQSKSEPVTVRERNGKKEERVESRTPLKKSWQKNEGPPRTRGHARNNRRPAQRQRWIGRSASRAGERQQEPDLSYDGKKKDNGGFIAQFDGGD